jgi:beta-glucuronidase
MDLADRHGILIIDELPAVGMHFFTRERKVFTDQVLNDKSREHHIDTLRELIRRDKNHPCVVMWSLANEAATYEEGACAYFKPIIDEARKLDSSRPLTIAHCPLMDECLVANLVDVLCLNRYYAWYFDPGRLELIEEQLEQNLRDWYKRYNKPIIISEYGADTVAGLHQTPPTMFSEEFQVEFLKHYHNVFDRLDFVAGEHVWNFADFGTKEGITRVGGNLKGVFTRQRQPKMAAHLLRQRWTAKDAGKRPLHDNH